MLEALERGVKGGKWFSLIDKVSRRTTLEAAWKQVRANKGSAGTDHQGIGEFEVRKDEELGRLEEELSQGRYKPRPIRRVYIDKPGSREKRPLGIPCVRDRVVQSALRLVIEPIFEARFAENSYGFRPRRGCKDALRRVDQAIKEGYRYVVDADIRAYFDNIDHERLMADVRESIADGRVLALIEAFLKQDVLEAMKAWTPESGTPQGAVISPLLANLYLNGLDHAMAKAGYLMIRYADDFVVLCRSRKEAEQALELVGHQVDQRGLSLHPEKTHVVDLEEAGAGFDFLGYHFTRTKHWPRKKSLKKLKDAIRQKTRRTNGASLQRIITDVNRSLRGWMEYFKHSPRWTFPRLDSWVRRRLRSILRKRSGRKGISRGRDHNRWPNVFFERHGLYSLVAAHRAMLQSSEG
ncbi:MAG: group II intron reverse transcriptase/maturase [Desulfacinum sp.]|nr:group II intron reverse transcriptase/maturase [Desulfacinum sp.]